MTNLSQLASWLLMSLGASLMLLVVGVGRLRRSLPQAEGERSLFGLAGEPLLLVRLLVSFAAGLGAVLLVGLIFLGTRSFSLFRNPILAVLLEETVKAAVLLLVSSGPVSRAMNRVSAAHTRTLTIGLSAACGMTLGMGFGLGESILYAADSPGLLLLRGVSSVVLHSLSGALLGRWAATRLLGKTCWLCLLAALLLHGAYNLLVSLDFPYSYLVFLLLAAFAMRVIRFFGYQPPEN